MVEIDFPIIKNMFNKIKDKKLITCLRTVYMFSRLTSIMTLKKEVFLISQNKSL